MNKFSGVLIIFIFAIFADCMAASAETKETKKTSETANYFVDGIKYRGEGKCEESIKSYQMARKHKLFKEDWAYHLAVADCYVALKKYDDAIDAYTRVIEGTQNKSLQAEMYKGRGRAYYYKSVGAVNLDRKLIELSKKNLEDAKTLGADISEIEKSMAADMGLKPIDSSSEEEKKAVSSKPVTIVEGQNKMIIGDGEYVIYLSGDTAIKDKNGLMVHPSEIKPGDNIDFTFATSYRSKADGMLHCFVKTVTLKRESTGKVSLADNAGKSKEDADLSFYIKMISQRLDRIDKDIREMNEKQSQVQNKKETQPSIRLKSGKKKKTSKKKPAETDKSDKSEQKPAVPKP